ncbi:hypothetical protein [Haloferax denitrificans]|uniref:hypothetical protein n=1 Tax=Haloferax denitrificans TaxID=35745 RepID=UPI003C6F756A
MSIATAEEPRTGSVSGFWERRSMKSLYSRSEIYSHFVKLPVSWARAEEVVRDELDLVKDHASWHDARTKDGEPIEIKSCVTRYADGRIGKFKIWNHQMRDLSSEGRVAFLLYRPNDTCGVLAIHTIPPWKISPRGTVTGFWNERLGWRHLREIPWPEIIPLDSLEILYRSDFAKYYSEEEVADTRMPYSHEDDQSNCWR